MKKLFTPEFKQKCLNLLLNERHTTIEVSKMMNVSMSALQRWKGVSLLSRPQIKRCCLSLSKEGCHKISIARCFGLNRTTLYRWDKM